MTDCVACLDPQNYAAIALKLQETAIHAEECIYALETSLREVTNPATIIATTSGVPNSNANILLNVTIANVTTYANSALTSYATATQWTTGMWQVGMNLTATATGAVTDNSYRELYVAVKAADITLSPAALPYPGYSQISMVTVTEPNTGNGVDMTISSVVALTRAEDQPVFFFRHGNTGSAMAIANGGQLWATRLGDVTSLRVV